jgi:hypothetical protein
MLPNDPVAVLHETGQRALTLIGLIAPSVPMILATRQYVVGIVPHRERVGETQA